MEQTPLAFREQLNRMAAQRADPEYGFFGPQTLVWDVNRERINYLGGLRAILMQLAHPAVARGVAAHSNFKRDPLGRFMRTMSVVQDILFGPADLAVQAATRVYALHTRVRGEGYHALDPDLLLWVYATLIDSLIFIHDEILPPLGDPGWARLYEEGRSFAHLFGVPDETLPASLDDFRKYVSGMVASLEVTASAREMARAVIRSPHPIFGVSNTILAAGTLPPRLREAFGLPWNLPVRAGYAAGINFLRIAVPLLPSRLRKHTLSGENDPISRLKSRLMKRYSHES